VRTVPALDRGLQILELLARRDHPVKPAEVATELAIPRSATYELVSTLRRRGYIEQDNDGGASLGPRLLGLGSRYAQRLDVTQLAQEVASHLCEECNETVQVGTLDGRDVLYIARADPSRMVRLVSAVGRRLPAHCTAIGKALLAQLEDAELEARLDGVELESLTPQSLTDTDELRRVLDDIRTEGVARDDRESNLEVRCVAAPVFDAAGTCAAAVSISVPVPRMTAEHSDHLAEVVSRGAAEMSARLGNMSTPALAPGTEPEESER